MPSECFLSRGWIEYLQNSVLLECINHKVSKTAVASARMSTRFVIFPPIAITCVYFKFLKKVKCTLKLWSTPTSNQSVRVVLTLRLFSRPFWSRPSIGSPRNGGYSRTAWRFVGDTRSLFLAKPDLIWPDILWTHGLASLVCHSYSLVVIFRYYFILLCAYAYSVYHRLRMRMRDSIYACRVGAPTKHRQRSINGIIHRRQW